MFINSMINKWKEVDRQSNNQYRIVPVRLIEETIRVLQEVDAPVDTDRPETDKDKSTQEFWTELVKLGIVKEKEVPTLEELVELYHSQRNEIILLTKEKDKAWELFKNKSTECVEQMLCSAQKCNELRAHFYETLGQIETHLRSRRGSGDYLCISEADLEEYFDELKKEVLSNGNSREK